MRALLPLLPPTFDSKKREGEKKRCAAGGGGAGRHVGVHRGTLALRDVATLRCGRARCNERMVGVNGAKRLGTSKVAAKSALNGWDGFTSGSWLAVDTKARPVDCGAVKCANWPP